MTAEVAILNKSAVALAADSAATIGDDAAGKIWNTVNKVFTLSKYHPVGIMIYANADYMGIPFETIIKMYREILGRKPDARIQDYATKFTEYLNTGPFSSENQQAANVRRTWQVVFDDMRKDITSLIQSEVRARGDCTTKKQKEIVGEVSAAHMAKLEKDDIAVGFEKKKPAAILAKYKKQYEMARNTTLGAAPNKLSEAAWKKIAGLAIIKKHDYSTYSGVVVTGFGESEIFPQYTVMRMSGIAAGVPKYEVTHQDGIKHDGSHSAILPFAQTEMVGRFMQGVDRSYEHYIGGAMRQAMKDLAKGIIDAYVPGAADQKDKTLEEVNKTILAKAQEFKDKSASWRRDKFVNPILEVVVSLPKEELANLAEALVNLTSIKRRVSTERETVGGPIDVAVISKGDGFVWIKRKHYFKPELNLNFSSNYWKRTLKEDASGNA